MHIIFRKIETLQSNQISGITVFSFGFIGNVFIIVHKAILGACNKCVIYKSNLNISNKIYFK